MNDTSKRNIPITAVDQFDFLDHRRQQEKKHWSKQLTGDPLDSILTVEINTTELCNRTCVFCPRHDPAVFPNRNLHLTVKGAKTIAEELADNQYQGKISFSGFGENLLNPNFVEIVKEFNFYLPTATLECNTNGDKLTKKYVERLYRAGLDLLYINLYDGVEQIEHFENIMEGHREDKYKFRMHWGDFEKHGLILNNRSGVIDWVGIEETDIKSLQGKPCHYPFYKLFVDWNGDVFLCPQDWQRRVTMGNIMQKTFFEIWSGKVFNKFRKDLLCSKRDKEPCKSCNADGTFLGKIHADAWKKHYSF